MGIQLWSVELSQRSVEFASRRVLHAEYPGRLLNDRLGYQERQQAFLDVAGRRQLASESVGTVFHLARREYGKARHSRRASFFVEIMGR